MCRILMARTRWTRMISQGGGLVRGCMLSYSSFSSLSLSPFSTRFSLLLIA
jgi:hypothetical protein